MGVAVLEMSPRPSDAETSSNKPNILLIITDDQGWGDIHSHGNDKIDTPVLDELAASGARFNRFYVSPVCAPTRASLLTGRYHLRTGTFGVTRGEEVMRGNEVTIADLFRQAGYATGCFGKWHNGAHYPHHPIGRGFDEFWGFCAGHWNNYFDTTLDHNGEPVKTKGYITDVLTDAAIAFLDKNRDRPFFCYIPYNAPHSPWQVPDEYFDKYKSRGLDDTTACAYGMCENVDDNIGRLVKKLDELNLAENTIVMFLTDNGPNSDRYNGEMNGRKGSTHEGGVRVPLFIRWPKRIESGTTVKTIAAHIDMLPTLVELAGVNMIETLPLDGLSLVPLLLGESADWPDRMLFTHRRTRGAVRTQRYRLVIEKKRVELYDMSEDPGEQNNAAEDHPEIAKELKTAYTTWLKEVTRLGNQPPPIPVGHAQMKDAELPAPECHLHGGVKYKGGAGWANDWVTNWTNTEAHVYWELEVVHAGMYEITLMYTCSAQDVGARLCAEVGSERIEGMIEEAHDPDPLPSPDRVPRKEVYEKVWAPLTLGNVMLEEGRIRLYVKALTKPGRSVMDLKSVRVRRLD